MTPETESQMRAFYAAAGLDEPAIDEAIDQARGAAERLQTRYPCVTFRESLEPDREITEFGDRPILWFHMRGLIEGREKTFCLQFVALSPWEREEFNRR